MRKRDRNHRQSQEEANRIVAKECSCGGAKQAEEIERKKQELRAQLDQLTRQDCEELNFVPLPEELRDILNQIGEAVCGRENPAGNHENIRNADRDPRRREDKSDKEL